MKGFVIIFVCLVSAVNRCQANVWAHLYNEIWPDKAPFSSDNALTQGLNYDYDIYGVDGEYGTLEDIFMKNASEPGKISEEMIQKIMDQCDTVKEEMREYRQGSVWPMSGNFIHEALTCDLCAFMRNDLARRGSTYLEYHSSFRRILVLAAEVMSILAEVDKHGMVGVYEGEFAPVLYGLFFADARNKLKVRPAEIVRCPQRLKMEKRRREKWRRKAERQEAGDNDITDENMIRPTHLFRGAWISLSLGTRPYCMYSKRGCLITTWQVENHVQEQSTIKLTPQGQVVLPTTAVYRVSLRYSAGVVCSSAPGTPFAMMVYTDNTLLMNDTVPAGVTYSFNMETVNSITAGNSLGVYLEVNPPTIRCMTFAFNIFKITL